MKQAVLRETLTGAWKKFAFEKMGRRFKVKNLSDDYILVSFEENDPHEWQCFKIAAGQSETVQISDSNYIKDEYKAKAVYVKGTGEVEVQNLDACEAVMPRLSLLVDPYMGDADLFGKVAADLQEDIEIDDGVTGLVFYVDGYVGFSGDPDEQKGNYLVLHAAVNYPVPITAQVIGGTHGAVTLDEDGILVARITSNNQSIRFTAATADETVTVELALTDLVLQEPLTLTIAPITGDVDLFGKVAADLQENIVIGEGITGTSRYVTGYTGFSGDPNEQEGNYLALHASANYDATIVFNGQRDVELDSDGNIVIRLRSAENPIRFTATYGDKTATVSLSIADLTLEQQAE